MSAFRAQTERTSPGPLSLTFEEWDRKSTPNLTENDLDFLETIVNTSSERIKVEYDREGEPTLRTKQHVGIVGLPDGPTLEIRPKAAGSNLLYLLQLAADVDEEIIRTPTGTQPGQTFLDVIGELFYDQLQAVLRQGLHKEYEDRQEPLGKVRGRWNLTRQVQRQAPTSTDFECDYEQQTADTILNQAILYALHGLVRLTQDPGLVARLRRLRDLLRRRVSLKPIPSHLLDSVQLNRLNDHYGPILKLTRLLLDNLFLEDLQAGDRPTYALLIDMNKVFEGALETLLAEALPSEGDWRVIPQASTDNLLEGSPTVRMYPDLVVEKDGEVVLVADAKWKTGDGVSNSDVYQAVSYSLARKAPAMLLYPEHPNNEATEYRIKTGRSLTIRTVNVGADVEGFAQLREDLVDELNTLLRGLVPAKKDGLRPGDRTVDRGRGG